MQFYASLFPIFRRLQSPSGHTTTRQRKRLILVVLISEMTLSRACARDFSIFAFVEASDVKSNFEMHIPYDFVSIVCTLYYIDIDTTWAKWQFSRLLWPEIIARSGIYSKQRVCRNSISRGTGPYNASQSVTYHISEIENYSAHLPLLYRRRLRLIFRVLY